MGIQTFENKEQLVPIKSTSNESFDAFTVRMTEVAREKIALVVGYFYNERDGFRELRCGPGTEPQAIVEAYFAQFQEGGLRPEVPLEDQRRLNNLLIKLPFLDFSNLERVLMWLHGFASITSIQGISYDSEGVLTVFKSHGYEPGMKFPGGDQENKGKRIVVSCLKELRNKGKIAVGMVYTYIGNWRRWAVSN